MSEVKFAFRAITLEFAQYAGHAAAVAGGYIATELVKLDVVSHEEWKRTQDWETRGYVSREEYQAFVTATHRTGKESSVAGLMLETDNVNRGTHLVMKVPADFRLAESGIAIPPTLIAALMPELVEKGYEVATEAEPAEAIV
jgi:hypothetical protein